MHPLGIKGKVAHCVREGKGDDGWFIRMGLGFPVN